MKRLLILLGLLLAALGRAEAASTNTIVLYSAGFEASEGFDPEYALAWQNGWVGVGTGGNGIVEGYFAGLGRQAYVGYSGPTDTNDTLNVWYPEATRKTNYPRIRFSVEMAILDSTNGYYDAFRWSLYNTNEQRLFSLDFDNHSWTISTALDDQAGFVSTGHSFSNSLQYTLVIDMDFASNRWSASLSGETVVAGQPITKVGNALNFGDMDAVWAVADTRHPGNNYMVFDEYSLVVPADPTPPPNPPRLLWIQPLSPRRVVLRASGDPGWGCVLETSDDLRIWKALTTGSFNTDGLFDWVDESPALPNARFYRASYVP